jgi:hypothetical protein
MRVEPGLPPLRTVRFLAACIGILYALWTWRAGVQVAVDTRTYSQWADQLIAQHFNIFGYLREQSFVVPPVMYLLWIVVVAALKTAFGTWWMHALVGLNCVSLTVGAYLTLSSVRRTTRSSAGLLLAAALFGVAGDLLIFVPFALSDLIFWGVSTSVVVLGLRIAADGSGGTERPATGAIVIGALLTAIALAFRPVAMPLVAFWLLAVAAGFGIRFGARAFAALTCACLAAIAVHAYVVVHPSAWPFRGMPAILALLAQEYRDGVLVYSPDNNFIVEPAVTWLGAVRLTFEKLLYYFTPWLPHYSRAHSAFNLAFFVPAYGLAMTALARARRLAPQQQVTAWLLAALMLCVSVFHAMMQIDYDHRYRLPLLPALIMMAAIGLEAARRPRMRGSSGQAK